MPSQIALTNPLLLSGSKKAIPDSGIAMASDGMWLMQGQTSLSTMMHAETEILKT
jgi:hypothetical protein